MDWTSILIGTAAGAAVMFFWLAVAWMALRHHHGDFRGIPDAVGAKGERIADAIRDLEPGKAFYCFPFMNDYPKGQSDEAYKARIEKGPNAMITVMPRGDSMGAGVFLRGFLINLLDAFGLALLCTFVGAGSLSEKVLFCAAAGAFLGISGYGGMSNWMFLPWRFAWMSVIDRIVGFALIGVVLHYCLPAPI